MITSIVPRAVLHTVSSASSSLSSVGSSTDSTDKRHVAAITTAVSRNVSSGNAVQINGHVAGKLYNINVKNLVIKCQCSLTSRMESHEASQPNGSVLKNPISQAPTPQESIVEIPDSNPSSPAPPAQNLCLYSKISKRQEPIRAIFRPTIHDNFIARRIVNRMELTSHNDPMVIKTVVWGGKRISSTSKFVELACAAQVDGTTDCVAYRFYIVKDCPFDLLFGSSSITPRKKKSNPATLTHVQHDANFAFG